MSEIYRDGSEGAAAHRDDLLRRRRDELALLPHEVRRVVVARSARVGAAVAVIAVGAALIVVGESPSLAHAIASALPNHPALLTALLATMWGAGLFAWWVARARCEHRFAVAMSRYVLPGRDLDHDLQRLDHEHPDLAARGMAHRLEGRALALPVVAASVLVPATAIYLAAVRAAGTWPPVSAIETGLADNAGELAGLAALGVAAAWLFGSITRRQPRVLVAIDGLALISSFGAFAAANADQGCAALGILGVATVAGALAVGVRTMLAERRALGDEVALIDAPITVVTKLVRRGVTWVGAKCLPVLSKRRYVCLAAALLAFAVGFVDAVVQHRTAQPEQLAQVAPSYAAVPHQEHDGMYATAVTPSQPSKYYVFRDDGGLLVDVKLAAGEVLEVKPSDSMPFVPKGWQATLSLQSDATEILANTSNVSDDEWPKHGLPATLQIGDCDHATPLTFHVHALPPTSARLHVTVDMHLAHCAK